MQVTKNLVHWTLRQNEYIPTHPTREPFALHTCSGYTHACQEYCELYSLKTKQVHPIDFPYKLYACWTSVSQECSGSWSLQTKSPCPLMSQQEATIHRSPVRRFALASWMRARNTVTSAQGKRKWLHLNPHHQNWRDLQWTSTARLYRLYLLVIRPYMHEHQHALNNPKKRGSAAERSS